MTTLEQMESALISINFYVGGLTDKAIIYYYNQFFN